jgi:outer membrane protein OmpA-like peptidoglycan-associated protein
MSPFRTDTRIAAAALLALVLAGQAPQRAAAQEGGRDRCTLWSRMDAAAKAGDLKAAAAAAQAIEDEPHCNSRVVDAKKAVVEIYRTLDGRWEREKVAAKDLVKHLQNRVKHLEEALTIWDAYDIHTKVAELRARLPGKRDHTKIGMALDRALVAIDDMAASERPSREEIRRLAQLAYQHEALAAAAGTPIQREGSFRDVVRQLTVGYVPAPLQFKYNEAVLTLAGEAQAKALLIQLQARKTPPLKIIGHTDPDGTFEENDQLSLRRAAAIKQFLEDNGYPPGRITIAGRGKRDVASYESQIEKRDSFTRDEIHQMLRRVELKFVD